MALPPTLVLSVPPPPSALLPPPAPSNCECPDTLQAAQNFATELDLSTGAWFAGEDMGGSPNLYGDTRRTDLPTSGQVAYIAKVYWEKSTPDDPRITIEPESPVPYTLEDYLAGRDPVLDAVIEETPPGV